MLTCYQYCGVACTDGNCPNVLNDLSPVSCLFCSYNNGCSDCIFSSGELSCYCSMYHGDSDVLGGDFSCG